MKDVGDKRGVAMALTGLGLVACLEGNDASAYACYRESLAIFQALGDKHGIAESLEGLARLAAQREPLRAARLWGAAEVVREAIGAPLVMNEGKRYEREVTLVRERLDEDAFGSAWEAGREMSVPEAVAFALDRGGAGARD